MNESELTEMSAIYEEAYREAFRASGEKSRAADAAKATLYECYPNAARYLNAVAPRSRETGFTEEEVAAGGRLLARMGSVSRGIVKAAEPAPEKTAIKFIPFNPPLNNNGHAPAPLPRPAVSASLALMLAAANIRAGDVFVVGNLDALTALLKCAESSIQSTLVSAKSGPLQQVGWRFEGMNAPRHDYRVKCVAAPRTDEEIRREELERRKAQLEREHAERLAALMAEYAA